MAKGGMFGASKSKFSKETREMLKGTEIAASLIELPES